MQDTLLVSPSGIAVDDADREAYIIVLPPSFRMGAVLLCIPKAALLESEYDADAREQNENDCRDKRITVIQR